MDFEYKIDYEYENEYTGPCDRTNPIINLINVVTHLLMKIFLK